MKPINRLKLFLLLIPVVVVCFLVMQLLVSLAGMPLWPHPILAVLIVSATIALWQAGRAVLALKKRKSTWLRPAQAPYVAYTAQAVAYWCIYMLGYLLALTLLLIQLSDTELPGRVGWRVALVTLCTAVFLAVGLIVEKWCQVDLTEENDNGKFQEGSGLGALDKNINPGVTGYQGQVDWD